MKCLESFIVASSGIVFLPFFIAVSRIDTSKRNYTYLQYTIVAPIYLGLMNMLGGALFSDSKYRYILTGLISGITVAIIATLLKSYNYTPEQWRKYYLYIVLKHIAVFGIVVNGLEYFLHK